MWIAVDMANAADTENASSDGKATVNWSCWFVVCLELSQDSWTNCSRIPVTLVVCTVFGLVVVPRILQLHSTCYIFLEFYSQQHYTNYIYMETLVNWHSSLMKIHLERGLQMKTGRTCFGNIGGKGIKALLLGYSFSLDWTLWLCPDRTRL